MSTKRKTPINAGMTRVAYTLLALRANKKITEGEILAHHRTIAAYTARGLDASRIEKVSAELVKSEALLAKIVAELAAVEAANRGQ